MQIEQRESDAGAAADHVGGVVPLDAATDASCAASDQVSAPLDGTPILRLERRTVGLGEREHHACQTIVQAAGGDLVALDCGEQVVGTGARLGEVRRIACLLV
jgi:hypothetical protein